MKEKLSKPDITETSAVYTDIAKIDDDIKQLEHDIREIHVQAIDSYARSRNNGCKEQMIKLLLSITKKNKRRYLDNFKIFCVSSHDYEIFRSGSGMSQPVFNDIQGTGIPSLQKYVKKQSLKLHLKKLKNTISNLGEFVEKSIQHLSEPLIKGNLARTEVKKVIVMHFKTIPRCVSWEDFGQTISDQNSWQFGRDD